LSKHLVAVAVAVLCLAGCTKPPPKRPDTAVALCEQLAKKYFAAAAGKSECRPVTDPAGLTLLQAIEGATLVRPGQEIDKVMFVSYRAKVDHQSIGGLMQAMVHELTFALPMLEASNEGARVSVWVVRGELSANHYEQLQKDIAAFAGDATEG
jgi:hypothetical protein